jgi:transposase
MLHRVRDQLIGQRTATINALRGHLTELGIVAAQRQAGVRQLLALPDAAAVRSGRHLSAWLGLVPDSTPAATKTGRSASASAAMLISAAS